MSERHYQMDHLINDTHEHCWHVKRGPYMAVLKDGYMMQECCKCPDTRSVHRDHADESSKR